MAKPLRNKKRDLATLRADSSKQPQQPPKTPVRHALSGWPMLFAWLAMLIFTGHACTHMVAAGDTWVAMACGRHFVNRAKALDTFLPFHVDTIEPFSANSHEPGPTPEEVKTWPNWAQWITEKVGIETVKKWHPTGWVNQNWLTHVIFYSLIPKSSYADGVSFPSNALVYWKFAIYIITVVCVYYTARLLGVNPALAAAFSCFAMYIGRSFLDIRPAGFSNMLTAIFLLLLVLATYRNVLYIWLVVPLIVFWCNVHGGYIYVFIMLVPFIGLHLMTVLSKKWTAILYNVVAWPFLFVLAHKTGPTLPWLLFTVLVIILDIALIFFNKNLVTIKWKGVCHVVGAYFAALFAAVLFNPFHLTNFTHTFVISFSKHAERWRDIHEWHPAFEWTNPVGTAVPFLYMFIIAWAAIVLWAVALIATSTSVGKYAKRTKNTSDGYQWPKIDLSLMLIAALTIYMAIRSRRFIPIAAIAACPVIAMFIDQLIRAIAATRNFHKSNRLAVPQMWKSLQLILAVTGAGIVLCYGIPWALRFKLVYLDPWPNDPKLSSVFMRMTASDAKPFYTCKFIKMNNLEGNMLNYWTEGGFIAFGQQPDPKTGKTPLQLFMDGRAQAAYDRRAFDAWTIIMSGGETIRKVSERARVLGKRFEQVMTGDDYKEISKWVNPLLRKRNVWVVMMPATVYSNPRKPSYHFIKALEYDPDWRLVLFNNKQKLFVDYTTPQGKELFNGIFNRKTLYPDEYHWNLAFGHNCLLLPDKNMRKQGLEYIIKAFDAHPSPAPMLEIIVTAARDPELRPDITEVCKSWLDKFTKNQQSYSKQNGYRFRIESARLACVHLQKIARARKNTKLAADYAAQIEKFVEERNEITRTKRW